ENLKIASKWLQIESFTNSNILDIIECNCANHSLSCLLQTLKQNHQSIITEPFTYPAFKTIALNNGLKLFPSEFDNVSCPPIFGQRNGKLSIIFSRLDYHI
ncbi:MAG: hypothetical protein ACIWVG_08215, partial [Gloeotrichia echinulata HAB0833]